MNHIASPRILLGTGTYLFKRRTKLLSAMKHRIVFSVVLFTLFFLFSYSSIVGFDRLRNSGYSWNKDPEISHVTETAQRFASGISLQLRHVFESLQHPKNEIEISDEDLIKYYEYSFIQLSQNNKGLFYKTKQEHFHANQHKHYSCQSRRQRFAFHRRSVPPPSPNLYAILSRYAEFHKNCTAEMENWKKENFKDILSNCRFIYFPSGDQGLGNKLLSLVSTVVYAILTQRVILIDPDPFSHLLCEPFPFSSWIYPLNVTETLFMNSVPMTRFLREDRFHNIVHCTYGSSFSCESSQKKLYDVPWIIMDSNVYFLPELFAVPSYQTVLKEMFPNNLVFTPLSRWFLLPKDDTWQRIIHLKNAYMPHADRFLGMHVRYLVYKDIEHYTNHFDHIRYINKRVKDCVLDVSQVLPLPKGPSTDSSSKTSNSKAIVVFIASQFSDSHAQYLKELYMDGGENGEFVSIQHITATHKQLSSLEEHKQSFTEMWILSSMDDIITSANSTFSYIAQGLGGHYPWILNFWPNPKEHLSCMKRYTSEPCHLNASLTAQCSFTDSRQVDIPFSSAYPFLHTCSDRANSLILSNYSISSIY